MNKLTIRSIIMIAVNEFQLRFSAESENNIYSMVICIIYWKSHIHNHYYIHY